MQPRPKVKNPMKTLKRLLGIIFKRYKLHLSIVFVCIIVSVLANVQGTMFIQKLIDDYITPMVQSVSAGNPADVLFNRSGGAVCLLKNYGLRNPGHNARPSLQYF